jgi:leucyl/phenylalanyl-tRNA---protein transferase
MPIYRLTDDIAFPPVHFAEDGLLAVGGDLRPERLLLAYGSGIFPWYSEGEPLLWWSPDPRMVMFPDSFHCARSLRRVVNKGVFEVTLNRAFPEVIEACSGTPRPGQDGTWITSEMEAAYVGLHEAGYAMSIECWAEGKLAGGLYGIALGGCFFGESMFSHQANASKVAMHALIVSAKAWGIPFIDCQVANPHLASLGAQEIGRREFMKHLDAGLRVRLAPEAWKTLPEGV